MVTSPLKYILLWITLLYSLMEFHFRNENVAIKYCKCSRE